MGSRCLDRMIQLDLAAIDGMALPAERIGNVLGRDRSEQLAFFTCFAAESERDLAEGGGQLLCLAPLCLASCRAHPGLGRNSLLVSFARLVRQSLRQEIVPSV